MAGAIHLFDKKIVAISIRYYKRLWNTVFTYI